MTRMELEAFTTRHIQAIERHDAVALASDYTPDGIVESPMFATVQGRSAIEASWRAFFTAFPDSQHRIDAVLIDPPRVAIFTTVQATHVNEFFGIPGSHKRFEIHPVSNMTLENGLIAWERRIYDFTGLLLQIGVLRAKPAKS